MWQLRRRSVTAAYVALATACVLCSCGPTVTWIHEGPHEIDVRAKSFPEPPSDAANIYVIGRGHCLGPVSEVFLDGESVGVIDAHKYRLVSISPGKHSVGAGWGAVRDSMELTAEGGKRYFVSITIEGGIWSESHESVVGMADSEGRNLVLQSTLAGELRGVMGPPVSPSHNETGP